MKFKKYTKEQLLEAIKTSYSKREALKKLNVSAVGGQYATLNKAITLFNIDISHFTGKLWNKGKQLGPKQDISEYLNNNLSITSHKLRLRLFKENLKEQKCEVCGLTEWNNNTIPLELDHIDGNHHNNNLSNLMILCPNCHAQTNTYCRPKKKII